MVDHHHPDQTESKPLNTELETLAPEATEHTTQSTDSTTNHATVPAAENASAEHESSSSQPGQIESLSAGAEDDVDYDSADFAAAGGSHC